ncbi:unnamed protein product [Soboliphyme baturini]|uniref:NADH dehydrogenase [ubiquinone] 1 beta subcomplex subunit 10 n=1 Tax=Soboliphyme baturini TaxID=241478 RepID=A0A183IEW3_9BILA|nr:unnamed protein product [Soboliphyme baturini]
MDTETKPTKSQADILREKYRQEDREAWQAYWTVMDLETRGRPFYRMKYIVWRCFDVPATWFREKIVEPLHDKYRKPFYHYRFRRAPSIDECSVNDKVCYHEAQWQFRLDKLVDAYILDILRFRLQNCRDFNKSDFTKCVKCLDDFEEADLNYYIKYGEMGYQGDALMAYMKQKHRMVWERRHPEIMKAREEEYQEHKRELAEGKYDHSFWRPSQLWHFKEYFVSVFAPHNFDPLLRGKTKPVSLNPEYYKEQKEAEERGEKVDLGSPLASWP